MTINQKIFKLLEEKGVKQADLAKYLNINQSVITTWKKRGTTPPFETIICICEYIGISITELAGTSIDDFDSELLKAYHAAELGTQKAICKLLDLEQKKINQIYIRQRLDKEET